MDLKVEGFNPRVLHEAFVRGLLGELTVITVVSLPRTAARDRNLPSFYKYFVRENIGITVIV